MRWTKEKEASYMNPVNKGTVSDTMFSSTSPRKIIVMRKSYSVSFPDYLYRHRIHRAAISVTKKSDWTHPNQNPGV